MRTKKVNCYWCDFCNKKGLSAGHMKGHERHCTLNPDRQCRVCKILDVAQVPIANLISILPDSNQYLENLNNYDDNGVSHILLTKAVASALPSLREAAHDCPACIMAALRQSKIPVPMVEGFSFTQEMKEIWSDINNNNMEHGY